MPKRNILWFLAVVAAALVVVVVARKEPTAFHDRDAAAFQPVQQTYSLIRQRYVEPIEDEKLQRAAVEGMVRALDPFSVYIPPEQADAFEHRVTAGLVHGLGLQVARSGDDVVIAAVLPNSPAHRGGLLPGGRIVRLDGKTVGEMTEEEVKKLLAGPLGTKAELTIAFEDAPPRTITLTRSEFPVESVEGLRRDDAGQWVYLLSPPQRLGYIRVQEFLQDTDEQFQLAYRSLTQPQGLIIDLRGNPGGSLDAAVRLADLFLREGLIVSTIGRDRTIRRHMAHGAGTYDEIPLAVLIDEKTASAAEILCGALALHQRAVLVGARSRGKGCVQSILDLGEKLGKLSLTTSRFYLGPLGSITRQAGGERWGIDPDVPAAVPEAGRQKLSHLRRQACAIRRPPAPAKTQTGPSLEERTTADLLQLDAPLERAADLLAHPSQYHAILEQAAAQARAAAASAPATDHD